MNHAIDTDGHELAILRGGRDHSTPVVFVHGISASINIWPVILPENLRDELNWCSLSLPGHYPAKIPVDLDADTITPELFSSLMVNAIEKEFGNQPVHLIGWSTGGFAVLNLAAAFPERFASVMSIAGYARGRWSGSLGWLQTIAASGSVGRLAFRRLFARLAAEPAGFRHSMGMLATNRSAWKQSPLRRPALDALYEDFQHHNYDVLGAFFARIRSFDITDSLSRITADMMIVNGQSDPAIPAAEAHWIHDRINGSELVLLPDCGHMFFAEAQAEFNPLLHAWLKRHDLPG